MDYLYFSHEGESTPDPQPGLPVVEEPQIQPLPDPEPEPDPQEGLDQIINHQSPYGASRSEEITNHKFIIDGRLFIIRGEQLYDVLGRKW